MQEHTLNRRSWLKGMALTSTAVAAATMARAPQGWAFQIPPAPASAASAGPALLPQAVVAQLLEGNRRFAAGDPLGPHRDPARVTATSYGQAPMAAVLGCADSRVPVELVFDQGIGDIFVGRVAGNVATPDLIASLEYGTEVLGAAALMVLGHTDCGAISAAAAGEPVPGQISGLFQYLQPALHAVGNDPVKAVAANVRAQVALLSTSSPVLAARVRSGRLAIVGGVYDVATGRVTLV